MTKRYQSASPLQLAHGIAQVPLVRATRLRVRQPGWLWVQRGRVWITRDGAPDDLVLDTGGCIELPAGARLVVEPWGSGTSAQLTWKRATDAPTGLTRTLRHQAARSLRGLAAHLDTAARGVEAMARRADAGTAAHGPCAA